MEKYLNTSIATADQCTVGWYSKIRNKRYAVLRSKGVRQNRAKQTAYNCVIEETEKLENSDIQNSQTNRQTNKINSPHFVIHYGLLFVRIVVVNIIVLFLETTICSKLLFPKYEYVIFR
jgi:hypothetical protein